MHSERFARLHLLLGDDGLDNLKNSTVMVLGLGGVGSACAEALARGGVGTLILVDRDTVEESNINRQALAFTSTLGQVKADVMSRMVAEINPSCTVYAQQIFLTPDNVPAVLGELPRPDYVLDCIDTISQKLAIAHWCASEGLPLLSSMGAANRMDPSQLKFANLRKTTQCQMSKVMRLECEKRRIKGVEVLFSTEVPVKLNSGRTKGESLGSMSYMPPIMGLMIAGKVIQRMAGLEPMARPPRLFRTREEALAALGEATPCS
ncbi:tRNA threonylcarbamoyladenosine dehydratase [Corynebacterium kalinowskii]|uniref:tRNA threonylcarbamoyladenosine dehydratase n=1 Tax=Corynebacterium kalinowskii TaxID=2675216 RepID=A0A6B8VV42_9CORY|nr:tRNA threonylcarbamoyladenosine dehydratase [Corynebacterium kalinowskii]QGU01160.1 tRNA threonylcarbamoyladenosine dehydratase [Corynebacterium kalinowskii]